MNFDYRMNKLCPAATAPGFFSHQSDMQNISGDRAWDSNRFVVRTQPYLAMIAAATVSLFILYCLSPVRGFEQRDFDYFGYRYALLASVGSAGLNSIVNSKSHMRQTLLIDSTSTPDARHDS